jgi:hypothetical protein
MMQPYHPIDKDGVPVISVSESLSTHSVVGPAASLHHSHEYLASKFKIFILFEKEALGVAFFTATVVTHT